MKNKIKIIGISTLLLILLSFNVFGLSFILELGGGSTLPTCSEDEFLLYGVSGWECTPFTTGSGLTLTCGNGEIIVYNTTSSDWECSEYPTVSGGSSFNLTCSVGQTAIYNGSEWVCDDVVVDTNVNTIYSCSVGEILEYNGTAFECGTDSTGSDDQTLFQVLTEGDSANGLNIYDVNAFNMTGTFRQGIDGNMFIYDINNEIHHVNVDLERLDELRANTFTNTLTIETFYNATGSYINVSGEDGSRISFVVNYLGEAISESMPETTYILPLFNGTTANPILNKVYAYINSSGEPVIEVSTSDPTFPHAMISRVLVGAIDSEPYVSSLQEDGDNGFIKRVQRRFRKEGLLYESGLDFNATISNLKIENGTFINGIYDKSIDTTLNLSDGFFLVREDGTYIWHNSFDDINQYSDGGTIGSNKYFNVVFGVVPYDGMANIYAVVQRQPIVEYTSTVLAYADNDNVLNVYPNDEFLKIMFLPVARMVLNENGDAQLLPNGFYAVDYRGGVAGGVSSGGGLSESDPIWTSEKVNYYTKTEINSTLLNYYLKTNVYNKTEIDTFLLNYYTKTQLDNTYLFNKSCGDGEYLKFNNTADAWDCVTLSSGSGDVVYGTYWNNSGQTLEINKIKFDYIDLNSSFNTAGRGVLVTDGSQDSLSDTGSEFNLNGDYSFNIWVNYTTHKTYSGLYDFSNTGSNGGVYTLIDSAGKIIVVNPGASNIDTGSNVLSTGTWHMVTVSRTGTTVNIYIDNSLAGTGTSVIQTATGSQFMIGNEFENIATRSSNAIFDEAKLFNDDLTSAERLALYEAGVHTQVDANSAERVFYANFNSASETGYTLNFNAYVEASSIEGVLYADGLVSATGYVTRTPKDIGYTKINKKIDNINLSSDYRDENGKLNLDLLFNNERVNTLDGSYLVDALADNNRVMIYELIEERNALKYELESIKSELCLAKKYSWCET